MRANCEPTARTGAPRAGPARPSPPMQPSPAWHHRRRVGMLAMMPVRSGNVDGMQAQLTARAPAVEEAAQRLTRRLEGDLVPGNLVLGKQPRLQRLRPGVEVRRAQAGVVEEV